jgi:hypothetical protein
MHFYNVFDGPKWRINTSTYGHIDMLDDYARGFVTFVRFCSGANNENDFSKLRTFIAGAVKSFIEGAVSGDRDSLKYIENEAEMPIDVKMNRETSSFQED